MKFPDEKRLLRLFDLTLADWNKIFNFQEGKCAICGEPLDKLNKKGNPSPIHTDHRHHDGLIRGLLCFRCNSVLAEIFTVAFVRKILAYLENPPATAALGTPHYGLPGRVGTKMETKRKLARKLKQAA